MFKNFDFVASLKKCLIISGSIFMIGIIIAFVFGIELDINFKGGSRYTYTYTSKSEIVAKDAESAVENTIGKQVDVSINKGIGDAVGTNTIVVSVPSGGGDASDTQAKIKKALDEKFPKDKGYTIGFGESNAVKATVAQSFFVKSIVAIAIAGILVILYIALRFRKIGGISAGLMAFVALVHDMLIAFFACVIFRLQIDTNFMAVILTILGYSLNDTIIIYDRVRENRRLNSDLSVRENVNISINQTLGRTLMTALATFMAVAVVALVAEFFGLTSLRSFAIPMAIGVISGSYSTIFLAGPLWVYWKERQAKKSGKKR